MQEHSWTDAHRVHILLKHGTLHLLSMDIVKGEKIRMIGPMTDRGPSGPSHPQKKKKTTKLLLIFD